MRELPSYDSDIYWTQNAKNLFGSYLRNFSDIIETLNLVKRAIPLRSDDINELIKNLGLRHNEFNHSKNPASIPAITEHLKTLAFGSRVGQLDHLLTGRGIEDLLSRKFSDYCAGAENDLLLLKSELETQIRDYAAIDVPTEIAAPLRVAIVDDRITISIQQSRVGSIDYPSANRIRLGVVSDLSDLIIDIESNTNIDKRYIRALSKLVMYLSDPIEDVAIEALGLKYQVVSAITERKADEIDDIILEELRQALSGVGVLLNQFEEWRQYLVELSLAQLGPDDGERLIDQAKDLIRQIESENTPVDVKVASRFKDMIEPVVAGLVNADTIAGPLLASFSNYFGLLSNYLIENTPVVTNLHPVVAFGGSALLLSYASQTLRSFCPTISQFQPLSFVINVLDWFGSRYSQTKDALS